MDFGASMENIQEELLICRPHDAFGFAIRHFKEREVVTGRRGTHDDGAWGGSGRTDSGRRGPCGGVSNIFSGSRRHEKFDEKASARPRDLKAIAIAH